jgi:hypothetical protein
MQFLEKDLEQIIHESNKDYLHDRGINVYCKLIRQLRIKGFGVADLVGFRRPYYHSGMNEFAKGLITVYELKQKKINTDTFLQALWYLNGIRNYLISREMEQWFDYEIVLVGKDIDLSSKLIALPNFNCPRYKDIPIIDNSTLSVEFYLYKYDADGIIFKNVNELI